MPRLDRCAFQEVAERPEPGAIVREQADLSTAGAVEKLFSDAVAAVGRPDIAINTVGKVLKKPFVDITEAEYDEMTTVNSKSAFFFLKEAGRHVNDNGKIIILVTSLLGAFTPYTPPMLAPRRPSSTSRARPRRSSASAASQ